MSQPLTVITGASSGIGLAAARTFAAAGHPLLLISRNIEPIAEFADKAVAYARVDVSDYDALHKAIQESEHKFGGTDFLVNSAGWLTPGHSRRWKLRVMSAKLTPICSESSTVLKLF